VLKTCDKPGCCPVEQTRGELGPGDYHDVIANNRVQYPGAVPEPELYGIPIWNEAGCGSSRPEHCVELNDHNKDDFRICCRTCGKTTQWGLKNIPGMPGAGADWMRKHWEKLVG
jgi:hypothetical protein